MNIPSRKPQRSNVRGLFLNFCIELGPDNQVLDCIKNLFVYQIDLQNLFFFNLIFKF